MNPHPVVLCLNSGSSTLKAALFQASDEAQKVELLARAKAQLKGSRPSLTASDAAGTILADLTLTDGTAEEVLPQLVEVFDRQGLPRPVAVGHRVAHGGAEFVGPTRLDDSVIARLQGLVPLAPLHLPAALGLIERAIGAFPDLPHVACFDTAFHGSIDALRHRLPLPRRFAAEGVRRYGFHGLSYETVLATLGADARGKIVIAHLGSGASLAAVEEGRSVDTTMGFTPTGGVIMGTRTGDLDPGVLIHLARNRQLDADALERLVNRESGLLGISETSSQMTELLAASSSDPRAQDAVDSFCLSVRKHVGAMAASLGGLDQLVFTAAVGENSPVIRESICAGLAHLGVRLDSSKNAENATVISAESAPTFVRVVPTDEERTIAAHVFDLVSEQRRS